MTNSAIMRVAGFLIIALTTIAAVHAGSTFRMVSYGPMNSGWDAIIPSPSSTSVYYSEQGYGHYGVTVSNGDVWGGYAARSGNRMHNAGFSYSTQYGLKTASINNNAVRGSIYRQRDGSYGGGVYAGSRNAGSFVTYPTHHQTAMPINYVGNSVYP